MRFMGKPAGYGYVAMQQAIDNSGLSEEQVSNPRTGIIMASGGFSGDKFIEAVDTMRAKGVKRMGPYRVTQIMGNTVSACLATPFKIKGVNYSITSACATSAHCIGAAVEQIQLGKQDVIFAGGGEEEHWSMAAMFDAMGALTTKYNDSPEKASRAYDADRDGFTISCGGGCVVVEELEHALARGANIIAEIVGYGATSDGYDMVAPSGKARCAVCSRRWKPLMATSTTSTPTAPAPRLATLRNCKPSAILLATMCQKSAPPNPLPATPWAPPAYTKPSTHLLMLQGDFICASANINNLDEKAAHLPVVTERIDNAGINTVMSNSFGFGGTNAALVMQRYK